MKFLVTVTMNGVVDFVFVFIAASANEDDSAAMATEFDTTWW
jgi:hypothetical protein